MTMLLRIVLIVVSILTTVLILRKIRQSKLQIEDSLFWIGFSFMLILFSVFPIVPTVLSELAGTYSTSNFIFLFVIFLLIVKLFHMTIKQSQMETRLRELVQKMAIDEKEERDRREKLAGDAKEEKKGQAGEMKKEADGKPAGKQQKTGERAGK